MAIKDDVYKYSDKRKMFMLYYQVMRQYTKSYIPNMWERRKDRKKVRKSAKIIISEVEWAIGDFFPFIPSVFSRFSIISLYNFIMEKIHLQSKQGGNKKNPHQNKYYHLRSVDYVINNKEDKPIVLEWWCWKERNLPVVLGPTGFLAKEVYRQGK